MGLRRFLSSDDRSLDRHECSAPGGNDARVSHTQAVTQKLVHILLPDSLAARIRAAAQQCKRDWSYATRGCHAEVSLPARSHSEISAGHEQTRSDDSRIELLSPAFPSSATLYHEQGSEGERTDIADLGR